MARALTISYGGFTIGDPPYSLHLPTTISSNYGRTTIAAQVVVTGTSVGDLESNEQALEAAFRKPRQNITHTKNGITRTFTEADRTALFIEASSRKVPDADFMGLAALYEISISFERPADLSGEDFLTGVSSVVTEDFSGKRTIEVRGQVTADSTTPRSARTQLAAVVDTFVGTVQDEVDSGATWEEIAATETWDRRDQKASWSRTVREIIADQGASGRDVASIRNESLSVAVQFAAPGDASFESSRLIPVIANYSCNVVHTSTTDLASVYTTEIRPLMLTRIRAGLGAGSIAIVDEVRDFDQSDNTIRARLVILAATVELLEAEYIEGDAAQLGVSLIPVWDGGQHSRAIVPAPGNLVRTDTVSVLVLGGESAARARAAGFFPRPIWSPESYGRVGGGGGLGGAISGEEAAAIGSGGSGGGWLVIAETTPQLKTSVVGRGQTFRLTTATLTRTSVYVVPRVRPQTGLGDSRTFSSVAP